MVAVWPRARARYAVGSHFPRPPSPLLRLAFLAGLGQKNMAFVDDREDINSIMMTAVRPRR
jgi:hypothetical protein